MAFFLLIIAVVNVALGYWLGLVFLRPDLLWTLRHRAGFASREFVHQIREFPSTAWGAVTRLLRQPPARPTP